MLCNTKAISHTLRSFHDMTSQNGTSHNRDSYNGTPYDETSQNKTSYDGIFHDDASYNQNGIAHNGSSHVFS